MKNVRKTKGLADYTMNGLLGVIAMVVFVPTIVAATTGLFLNVTRHAFFDFCLQCGESTLSAIYHLPSFCLDKEYWQSDASIIMLWLALLYLFAMIVRSWGYLQYRWNLAKKETRVWYQARIFRSLCGVCIVAFVRSIVFRTSYEKEFEKEFLLHQKKIDRIKSAYRRRFVKEDE